MDAALETFAEQGFAAASIEDVCSRGGFTRGAFYSSFASKDQLFAALYTREAGRDLARVEELVAGLAAEPDPLAFVVERCIALFRHDRAWSIVAAEYALHAARHPAAAELLRRHQSGFQAHLVTLIERAVADTGLQLAVTPAQLARALCAQHDGVTLRGLTDPAHADDLERSALRLLLNGAVAGRAAD
nr:TetR/AcrR family transcriptional regulator [Modestobacter versicolor]